MKSSSVADILKYHNDVRFPSSDAHKGENGKLFIVGGSALFHSASAWSLQVASRIVDMVFYSSVPSNNHLLLEAKRFFWDGIVVPRDEILNYIDEADVVLIGPGMERQDGARTQQSKSEQIDWDGDTYGITNALVRAYPQKKWVIDAGALQMIDPSLLTNTMILTPHTREFERVFGIANPTAEDIQAVSHAHNDCTIVVKGAVDVIAQEHVVEQVEGGNAGMTKGGTGDVLAGLIASVYCFNTAFLSSVVGSWVNKRAGDRLFAQFGPFYNATQLADEVTRVLWETVR